MPIMDKLLKTLVHRVNAKISNFEIKNKTVRFITIKTWNDTLNPPINISFTTSFRDKFLHIQIQWELHALARLKGWCEKKNSIFFEEGSVACLRSICANISFFAAVILHRILRLEIKWILRRNNVPIPSMRSQKWLHSAQIPNHSMPNAMCCIDVSQGTFSKHPIQIELLIYIQKLPI